MFGTIYRVLEKLGETQDHGQILLRDCQHWTPTSKQERITELLGSVVNQYFSVN